MEEPSSDVSLNISTAESSQDETEQQRQPDDEQKEKLVKLPMGRVRSIIKMDVDVNLVNQEALFLITKSTERFIESLATEAYKYTAQMKKKTVQKRDLESAISNVDALIFLDGMLDTI